jgi:hypothetical protein
MNDALENSLGTHLAEAEEADHSRLVASEHLPARCTHHLLRPQFPSGTPPHYHLGAGYRTWGEELLPANCSSLLLSSVETIVPS